MEILEVAKTKFIDDMEEEQQYFEMNEKKKKTEKDLSKQNIYSKIEDNSYFVKNFIKIMTSKFINIYYNINASHMSNNIENEEKKRK